MFIGNYRTILILTLLVTCSFGNVGAQWTKRLEKYLKDLESNDVYAEVEAPVHTQIIDLMLPRWIESLHGNSLRIVDLGAGECVASKKIAMSGHECTALTMSDSDITKCNSKNGQTSKFNIAKKSMSDLWSLSLNGTYLFDGVWARHVLEHSVFPLFTLSEIYGILKPGGKLYVEVPSPNTFARHEENDNHYSVMGRRMWEDLFRKAGFVSEISDDINWKYEPPCLEHLCGKEDRYFYWFLKKKESQKHKEL